MSIEDILADVKPEGDTDPFATLEKETLAESQTEKEPVKDEPVKEETPKEDEPFHKRWEKHAENLKTELETKHQQEIENLKREFETKYSRPEPVNSKIPDWFRELYGDNETAWNKYEEHDRTRVSEIEREIITRQEQSRQNAQRETEKWNKWVESEIDSLKGEGKQFDRNELIKVMLDYRPTDANNNFNFKKGYEIYEALKGKDDGSRSQARKQLGDTISRTSSPEKKSKDYMTANELRRKSWSNL